MDFLELEKLIVISVKDTESPAGTEVDEHSEEAAAGAWVAVTHFIDKNDLY